MVVDTSAVCAVLFGESDAEGFLTEFLEAGLNLGDCASYAPAKVCHQKLLYKGVDFAQTDLP